MIYVVTHIKNGLRMFCMGHWSSSARIQTKHEADLTMQKNAERGLAGLEVRTFKNLGEACSWRSEFNERARAAG